MPKEGKMKCSCGYSSEDAKLKDKKKKEEIIEVIEKQEETLPKIKANCDDCNNTEAYFWTLQTRSGDEGETRFFKCTKCSKVWREY